MKKEICILLDEEVVKELEKKENETGYSIGEQIANNYI